MCVYPSSNYALSHWKCVLHCCAQFTCIDLPSTESDQHNSNAIRKIRFHVYQQMAHCTMDDGYPFNEKIQCQLYEAYTDKIVAAKNYTRKELVMMESSIVDFHHQF